MDGLIGIAIVLLLFALNGYAASIKAAVERLSPPPDEDVKD
jgi:hypothetical protein